MGRLHNPSHVKCLLSTYHAPRISVSPREKGEMGMKTTASDTGNAGHRCARFSIEDIDCQLRKRVGELVEHLQGTGRNLSQSNKKTWRFGSKGGLAVEVSGPDIGRITPFDGDGKGRTPLQYICDTLRCPMPKAIEWAADWLGLSVSQKTRSNDQEQRLRRRLEKERRETERKEEVDRDIREARAKRIWDASQAVSGTQPEKYLTSRGITAALPEACRFHPALGYFDQTDYGKWPCLVLAATDNSGRVRAIQRIYLDREKPEKAALPSPKKTLGSTEGAAVRFPRRHGDELVLAEGPETGLSVWQAWGRETWVALGSISKLVDVAPANRPIIIARDADTPGSPADKALMKAVRAMIERGLEVQTALPPRPQEPGFDFNDALQKYGDDAVADALDRARSIGANILPELMPLDEARRCVEEKVTDFLVAAESSNNSPPVQFLNVGLGIGKTTTALDVIGRQVKNKNFAGDEDR